MTEFIRECVNIRLGLDFERDPEPECLKKARAVRQMKRAVEPVPAKAEAIPDAEIVGESAAPATYDHGGFKPKKGCLNPDRCARLGGTCRVCLGLKDAS